MRSRSSPPIPVDRRLSAVAEIDVPYYPGLRIGVPACPPPCKRSPTGLRRDPRLLPRSCGRGGPPPRAGARPAADRQLPHQAHRLPTCVRPPRQPSPARWRWPSARSIARATSRPLPQRGLRRRARRDRDAPRRGSCAGTSALTPRASTPRCAIPWLVRPAYGASRTARSNATVPGRITREKGAGFLLADAFLRARAIQP